MPNIHGSLTNDDFVEANKLAKEKNMELKDWVVAVILSEIHRLKISEVKQA